MRHLFVAAAFALLLAGCDSAGPVAPSGSESLTVDLRTNFDNDLVRVKLDGALIYEGRVTTNLSQGLAERATFSVSEGEHHIRVEVGGRASAAATFEAGTAVFVGVSYNPELRDIDLDVSDEIFCCYF